MNKDTAKSKELGSLIEILHITDPTLPIGGFSHSNGLETYVQQNLVKNASTTQDFVESMLKNNYKYNDALAVKLAYEFTLEKNVYELLNLDEECNALKAPREVREGSQKLGTRLIKIYATLLDDPFLNQINDHIEKKEMEGHYPIIYGIITSLLKIDKEKATCAFLYNAAVAMVTNAVKLVPLGQTDGQQIIYNVQGLIEDLTLEIMDVERELHGVCNTALDIKCMQHEHLYSRLYMS
ncbi:Urease accessory protein UreF [Arenibacter antarcticus]|uniref:Urease accessory protein UreF n=1 Tax=Arenibacter antarcticus TaxID=2040469 RepID=A0ABW5VE16_9FLAO|nr:urease accessory protein UreF [Arenibacter sp. H213]MCM4168122.1 urease accessory protein UreF [Arenibacter sp. H213]